MPSIQAISYAQQMLLQQQTKPMQNASVRFSGGPTASPNLAVAVDKLLRATKTTNEKEFVGFVEDVMDALPGSRLDTPLIPTMRETHAQVPFMTGCNLLEVMIMSPVGQNAKNKALKRIKAKYRPEPPSHFRDARENLYKVWVALAANNDPTVWKEWGISPALGNELRGLSTLQRKASDAIAAPVVYHWSAPTARSRDPLMGAQEYARGVYHETPKDKTLSIIPYMLGFIRYPDEVQRYSRQVNTNFDIALKGLDIKGNRNHQYVLGSTMATLELHHPMSSAFTFNAIYPANTHLVRNSKLIQAWPDDRSFQSYFLNALYMNPDGTDSGVPAVNAVIKPAAKEELNYLKALHPTNERLNGWADSMLSLCA